jgi:hypothetical protein
MANRQYVSTAHSYSILRGAVLQGLGNNVILQKWPQGRSYYDVSYFRSPYKRGMYNSDNPQLLGLGAPPPDAVSALDQSAPPNVKRFLLSGEPVSPLVNNVSLPFNQVPRLGYGIIAAVAAGLSYFSYKRFKKANGGGAQGT